MIIKIYTKKNTTDVDHAFQDGPQHVLSSTPSGSVTEKVLSSQFYICKNKAYLESACVDLSHITWRFFLKRNIQGRYAYVTIATEADSQSCAQETRSKYSRTRNICTTLSPNFSCWFQSYEKQLTNKVLPSFRASCADFLACKNKAVQNKSSDGSRSARSHITESTEHIRRKKRSCPTS